MKEERSSYISCYYHLHHHYHHHHFVHREAFPAGSGPSDRTTYLFTYMDAKPERPSIMEIMNDYWELLPRYQGVDVDKLQYKRILYGCFPTYRDSPLKAGFDRILQVGDASGIQSPLSFGGFGSLTRHIERIVCAVDEALAPQEDPMKELYLSREYTPDDLVSAKELGMINCYQPNLSTCWMFQRAMSVRIGNQPNKKVIVGTLSNSFSGTYIYLYMHNVYLRFPKKCQ